MMSAIDILEITKEVFESKWQRRNGRVVPESEDIALKNDAVCMEGAVLYADLAKSSELTQRFKDCFVAEVYKTFLIATSNAIKNNDGVVTAYDGDRVMAVFVGDSKCTNAAKAGLQIHAIIRNVNDQLKEKYPATEYRIDFGVGIDFSDLFVVKTGVRGSNDLAWIGDASNVAAKLSNVRRDTGKIYITERLYNRMGDLAKYSNGTSMWKATGCRILGHDFYESSWYWNF